MCDIVSLHELTLSATIGADWWGRTRPQPVLLTLHVHTDLKRAGASDDVAHSIHYGHLATAVLALQGPTRVFRDLADLAEAAGAVALGPQFAGVDAVRVVAEAPKLLLHGHGLGVDITRPRSDDCSDKVYLKDVAIAVVIGVNAPERLRKQVVVTNVVFHGPVGEFAHATVVEALCEHIEGTSFLTLEAFATSVARVACGLGGAGVVTVRAEKRSAVSFGQSSGVEITRSREFFADAWNVT